MAVGILSGLAIWALLIAAFGIQRVLIGALVTTVVILAGVGAMSLYGSLRLTLYRWRHRCL